MMDVRIMIGDLVEVCKMLNAAGTVVKVGASGSMYATISMSAKQRFLMAKSNFVWSFD